MQNYILHDLQEGKIIPSHKVKIYLNLQAIEILTGYYSSMTEVADYFNKTLLSLSTHTKLIPILEKTGAELFGDRFVLFDKSKKLQFKVSWEGHSYNSSFTITKYKETLLSEILQEYSKLLAGENNQFLEFCSYIK